MKYLAVAVACAMTACGSGAHEPHEITLTIVAVPDEPMHFLMYRDGGGPWTAPTSNADGTYGLVITDAYEVFAEFETPLDYSKYEIEEVRATADDPPPVIKATIPSGLGEPPGIQPRFKVSGQAADGTEIVVEAPPDAYAPTTWPTNGSFVADAFDTSDYLYAIGPNNNGSITIIVRRTFESGHDTSVGFIDVANEGRVIPTHPVTVSNAMTSGLNQPWAEVDAPGRLALRGSGPFDGSAFDMPLLPVSMRQPDDHYTVAVGTTDKPVSQNYRNTDAEKLSAVELMSPPAVDLVQFPTSATWPVDDRDAVLDATGGAVGHHVRATAGWLAATGASSLTTHEDLPGFDPSWQIFQTYHVAMSLTLSTSTPTTVNSVTVSN